MWQLDFNLISNESTTNREDEDMDQKEEYDWLSYNSANGSSNVLSSGN